MSKKLLDLYRSLISVADWKADDTGMVSEAIGKCPPVLIDNKRLVLPLKEQLTVGDWSERVAFHPLYENILRPNESEVLERFRTGINARFNRVIGLLAYRLMVIASSTAEHPKLNPDQHEFLTHVKNADAATVDVLVKLMKAMPEGQTQRRFVHIFLRKGATLNGVKHARVAVVHFPLYEALKKAEDNTVWDIKLRKKDVATLISLFEYLFPKIATPEAYNRASDSTQAPFLDALMKAVLALADPINTTVDLFLNQLDNETDHYMYDDAWVEAFQNIDSLTIDAKLIPMQEGNRAASTESTAAAPAQPATPAPAPGQAWSPPGFQAPQYQPMAFQQPTMANTMGTMGGMQQPMNTMGGSPPPNDFNAWLANSPAARAAMGVGGVPMQMQQPTMSGWQQPGMQQPIGNQGWAAQAASWSQQASMNAGWGNQQQGGWGNQQRQPGFSSGGIPNARI